MKLLARLLGLLAAWTPGWVLAAESVSQAHRIVGNVVITSAWILANICFAGLRAQNSSSTGWRVVAFLFGFPGTLLTYFFVQEGGERAYGVDLPKKRG